MLLDERYGQGRLRSKLPGWIQPSLFPAANKSCDFSEAFAQLVTVLFSASPLTIHSSFSAIAASDMHATPRERRSQGHASWLVDRGSWLGDHPLEGGRPAVESAIGLMLINLFRALPAMFTWILNTVAPPLLRSYFLCILGVQLFHLVCLILSTSGIDVGAALAYPWGSERLLHDSRNASRTLWGLYLAVTLAYCVFPDRLQPLVVGGAWFVLLFLLLLPTKHLCRELRKHFLVIMGRTLAPWHWRSPTQLVDVVLGDVLTSYSKILAEWDALLVCYLLRPPLAADASSAAIGCLPSILSVFLIWYRDDLTPLLYALF